MAAIPVLIYWAGVAGSGRDETTKHSLATIATHAFGAWVNQGFPRMFSQYSRLSYNLTTTVLALSEKYALTINPKVEDD